MIVGGTGFPGQIRAAQLFCPGCSASLDHILHHASHEKGIARVYDLLCFFCGKCRLRLLQDIAFHILYALDEIRRYAETSIGKGSIPHRHLHRCNRPGAQCHRQIGGMLFGIETKTGDVILGILNADCLENANGYQILGFSKRFAHA